ncbi:MAG: hypothetical protein QOJ98_1300 [Acidobacteriota bacterium]|jgi:hypothetical protein|nr:hypothetical protein [Acidobacteriota bacterium]
MKRLGRELAVVVLFCALTAVMTWPLAANFTTALPHPQDPAINTWILDWDFYAFLHQPLQLFDANLFHPHRYSLAFSENLIGIALPLLPLYLVGVPPITIFNVAMFLAFALSGYGAYVLARLVTESAGAAICSGIYFAFFSFRFTHLTHLQHLWAMWLPLSLASLIWFARKPSPKRAALFGIAFLMNGLSNLHWFAFGSLALGLSFLLGARKDRRYWIGGILATAVALSILTPVLLPYQRVRELYGFRGDPGETMQYSAEPSNWLISSLHSRWYASALGDTTVNPERWLFPGGLVLLFALIGLTWRGRSTLLALLWIALGYFGSLGLNGWFGTFLFDSVPLFKGIRVPARWSFIAYTGLALLAACGIARLTQRFGPKTRAAIHLAIACLFLIELHAAPIRWYLARPETPPVYRYLAANRLDGPLVELPLRQEDQYDYMLRATTHHRPMVNGVSGFVPPSFGELVQLSEQTPVPRDFLPRLEQLGVTTVVVHADRLKATYMPTCVWLREALMAGSLTFIRRFDEGMHGDYVFLTRKHRDFEPSRAKPLDIQQRTNLNRFLDLESTQNEGTFGNLEQPKAGEVVTGKLRVSGWALSPWGIEKVELRFANGKVIVPVELGPRPDVTAAYPWYPMTGNPGFYKEFDAPPGSDLQVEIVDGRHRRHRLEQVWFSWSE